MGKFGLGRLVLLLFLLVIPAFSQVDTAWVRLYNGPGNQDDWTVAMGVDQVGNVCVTGNSSSGVLPRDFVTVKYSPDGDSMWVRSFHPTGDFSLVHDLAIDNVGNVIITGTSQNQPCYSSSPWDIVTIKYTPNGDTAWLRYYNGPYCLTDQLPTLVVDGSGNVYVAGASRRPKWDQDSIFYNWDWINHDFITIKYAPNGDTLWTRRYNGPADTADLARAVAVDTAGNVYVTGESWGGGTCDYATIKYAPNGDTLWTRRYNGPGNLYDYPEALAVDNAGNVYVTGSSDGSGTSSDFATIKYAPNGDILWVRRNNGPGNSGDGASALAVDNAGNVYVTGGSTGSGTSYDCATIKYAPNGDTLWVRRYNGPANGDDGGTALAVDDSGNVYVTGSSIGTVYPDYDCATIKYAPNGDSLWVKRYNGPDNLDDNAGALEVDGSGNVYLAGSSNGTVTFSDYLTIKYVQTSCIAKPGDANASGTYTLADVIATVNYIFNKPGCSPQPLCWISSLLCRGDWNGSGTVSLSDVIQAVNFIFNKPGGPWNALPVGVCCL